MTVPGELEQAYNRVRHALQRLKGVSDPLLAGVARSVGSRRPPASRIKPVESVLLKIERDGPERPFEEIEDLFAATIVVPNSTLIPKVEEEVGRLFEIVDRVPPKTKKPSEFVYDDRHLILKLQQEPGREARDLASIRFELQIKTEMQAAASAVSREFSYKTKWLSWTRARMESSIRALVEMLDGILASLAESSDSEEPAEEEYAVFANRNKIVQILEEILVSEQLPDDRRRLAVVVEDCLRLCKPKASIEDLGQILRKKEHARITQARSLSAAGSVFIVLFLEGRLTNQSAKEQPDPNRLLGKRRYLVTQEMIDFCPLLEDMPEDRRVHLK
jgi:ppGpp synthetase/RelA/SpoT-type nucleotidyltranferase